MIKKYLVLLFCISCLFAESGVVLLPKNTVHKGNYVAVGRSIEIAGHVTGDVYVFGSQVYIDGRVDGDVIACAGTLSISGLVKENVRVVVGQLMISGTVKESVSMIAGSADFLPSGFIGDSLFGLGGNIDIDQAVHGDVNVYGSNVRLAGPIRGDFKAVVGSLHITAGAQVLGEVDYWSDQEAFISKNAQIRSPIQRHQSVVQKGISRASLWGIRALPLLMNFFYTYIMGLIAMRFFPRKVKGALRAIEERPIMSFFSGLVVLVLMPLLFGALLLTIVGAPFALALLALNVFGLYTMKIFVIFFILTRLFPRHFEEHRRLFLFSGLVSYFVVLQIPYLGSLIAFLSMVLGLGALITAKETLDWSSDQIV